MSIEDRSWMYQGWNDNGCHSQEWVSNTNAFLDNAFSIGSSVEKTGVACPCSDCCKHRNRESDEENQPSAEVGGQSNAEAFLDTIDEEYLDSDDF